MRPTKKRLRKYGNRAEKKKINLIKKHGIEGIRSLLDESKFVLAKTCMDEYIEENGYDCYIIHEYGKYYSKQFKLSEARKCFEKNINDNSENICYSLFELSKIEKLERNYDEAIKCLHAIIRSNHYDKSHARIELAKIYTILENYDFAEDILLEILNEDFSEHTYEVAKSCLIQSKINSGKIKDAEKLLEELKENSNHPKVKFLEGQLEERKNNKLKAYEIYHEIIRNGRECTENASYELAKIEMEKGNYDEAIKVIDLFIDDNSIRYNVEMFEIKINCYIKMGDYSKAKECIDKLISLNDKCENIVNYYLGKIEFYTKNYFESLEYYNKIDETNFRTYRDSLYKKMCCLIKLERYEDAYNTFEELKRVDVSKRYYGKYNTLELYLKGMMGQSCEVEPRCYIETLLIDYDYDLVIEHINKHKEPDETKISHTIFNENIDTYELYNYALDQINEENYLNNSFNDAYVFKYEGVGYSNTKELNYVKVVTIPNTKKIITMYPYDYIVNLKTKEKDKTKIKKTSRIDKFNQKYGIA